MLDWYVYDMYGHIEATDLSEEEAKEIVEDLNVCEPEGQWKYAEDNEEI